MATAEERHIMSKSKGKKEGKNMNKYKEALDILGELVEKATPKKPTEADVSEQNSYCAWLCPTCGRTHINNYPLNFCSDCGQKIDWSDYEKYLRDGESK